MKKKLILAGATVLIGVIAYLVFSSGDRKSRKIVQRDTPQSVRQFITPTTSKPTQTFSDADMTFSPGEQTRVRVYDEVTGRLKYQFEAKSWEPVSNSEFHLKELLVQTYTAKGEITYISSDEANVILSRKGKNRVEPKSGILKKNVKVVIDRTTSAWREANPTLADRDAHPEDLVHITLQEAHFDLEQAELHSDSAVLVDSVEARVENVRGLTLQWNQVDGRIDVLRFQHGGMMTLRRGGKMIDFAMPGAERTTDRTAKDKGDSPGIAVARTGSGKGNAAAAQAAFKVAKAQANQPLSIDSVSADEAAAQIRFEGGTPMANIPRSLETESPEARNTTSQPNVLRDPSALASAMDKMQKEARAATTGELAEMMARQENDKKAKRRIHTYRAVFDNKVVIEQTDAGKIIGKLEADKLELNFDFGKEQKEMAAADAPSAKKEPGATSKPTKNKSTEPVTDSTKIVLTWDGPLDMHPLRVDPSEQTGQRFDAVATGKIVKLNSEQGNGVCKQLVYRHERRQAWLSGGVAEPVQLSLNNSQRLVAREVFFDQKRGLAHIEGAGSMIDDRKDAGGADTEGLIGIAPKKRAASKETHAAKPATETKVKKPREPVEITWSQGVDIEMSSSPVDRINPVTGVVEQKQKESLRRAWFHGDVDMKQSAEHLTADQVAVTFAPPASGEQAGEHIQHLNMTGRVRLQRDLDIITADRLDAEMTVTDDKRNVPRIVDAAGDVIAQQASRIIRADKMHMTMGLSTIVGKPVVQGDLIERETKSRVGIESLDANGRVFVHDPDSNLKIRDADILKATMKNGSELVHATIDGDPSSTKLAKVRAGETAIHGRHIDIDMAGESIDVPGPGRAWLVTQQDFGGRKLSKPSPVRIDWANEMQMRGSKGYGVFLGDVHSKSDAFSMSCEKLTVRLADAPLSTKTSSRSSYLDLFWLTKLIREKQPQTAKQTATGNLGPRKRPTFVVAESKAGGQAEALSSTYTMAQNGVRSRLLNRMQILGPQIVVDLAHERMSVPAKGTLLLEDYQFDDKGRTKRSAAAPRSGPLMSSAQGEGPSQTLVKWDASMDYYFDQNLVAFDKNVDMRHFSGQQMAMKEDLVAGMGMDTTMVKNLKDGRNAHLTGGYLLLEFKNSSRSDDKSGAGKSLVRATDLERLIAKHNVHLQENSKSLMGEYVQYLASTNEVQVEGTSTMEARIIDEDEHEQRMNMWRGPILIWNRSTNAIEAPQSQVRTIRR